MFRKALGVFLMLLLAGSIVGPHFAFADTGSGSVTVGVTVPAASSGSSDTSHSSGGGTSSSDNPPPEENKDNPPSISTVVADPGFTGATVSWTASDDKGVAMSTFVYGTTMAYGMSATVTGNYQVMLSGLATDTVYFFRISVTDTGNHGAEFTGSFKTKTEGDTTAPIITNIEVVEGTLTATITWDTDEASDSQVQYGTTAGYGKTTTDTNDVKKHKIVLVGLSPATEYHFRVISTDANGNSGKSMDATFKTLKKKTPPPDVSGLAATASGNAIQVSWINPTEATTPDFAGVWVVRKVGSQSKDQSDGTTVYTGKAQSFSDKTVVSNVNYFYTVFSFDTSGNYSAGVFDSAQVTPAPGDEVCGNGIDDNANGKIDCADAACSLSVACTTPTPEKPKEEVPLPTVPAFLQTGLEKIRFSAVNRTVPLVVQNGMVSVITGFSFTVELAASSLGQKPEQIILIIDGTEQHQLQYKATDLRYYADLSFPTPGKHQSYLKIDYGTDQIDTIPFVLDSRTFGRVLDDAGKGVSNAKVTLLNENGTPVSLQAYQQNNPYTTGADGMFGFVVPLGRYYGKISAAGTFDYSIPLQQTASNVFAPVVEVITLPPSLADVIDFDKPLGENIINVSKNIAAKTKAVAKVLNNLSKDPQVQKATSQVVAPTTAGVVVISAAPLISWVDLLPLLRLVFLQPILLIGRKKREGWGQVYNSLSKLPVDLAIIRLVDYTTGRVVQSRVTDKNGHYYFTVNPGNYRLEVLKEKMVFPSKLLKDFQTDGQKADIYHGEQVFVKEKDPVITANIPLDPSGDAKTPRRLIWERFGKKVQVALSWFGLAVTAVSLYISPKWYIGALLVGHIVMFFVFRRLAMPVKPKSWGIVYDSKTKKPVGRAVARLFSSQFNKLVSTQITDAKGRYYFLAGDNRYFVTYDHKEYQPAKTEVIDLNGKEIATIGSNMGLSKKTDSMVNPAPPTTPLPEVVLPTPVEQGAPATPAVPTVPPAVPENFSEGAIKS